MKCNNGLKRVDFKHIHNNFFSMLLTFTFMLYVAYQLCTSLVRHRKTSACAYFKSIGIPVATTAKFNIITQI